ncbi:hypothetical protein NC651_012011 [Populus alba x Populus x berolinensis]|nr:hypothetical protein NC651_012011 [Populus alba x Populus x berolinensis]
MLPLLKHLQSHTALKHLTTKIFTSPPTKPIILSQTSTKTLGLGFIRRLSDKTTIDYNYIKVDINCSRCTSYMPVLFSNRPLSITGRETGIYQAINLCPTCKTRFYFRPFKLEPLQGNFIELGRVKGLYNNNNNCKDVEGIIEKECGKSGRNAEEVSGGGGGGGWRESYLRLKRFVKGSIVCYWSGKSQKGLPFFLLFRVEFVYLVVTCIKGFSMIEFVISLKLVEFLLMFCKLPLHVWFFL